MLAALLIAAALVGLGWLLFSQTTWVPLSLAFMVLSGVGIMLTFNTSNALLQLHTPDHLRGRVMSTYMIMIHGTNPIAALVIGSLATGLGEQAAVAISGVNTIIPAHYHGSIVGVTLALMGLTYHLLPTLGLSLPAGRMARVQPWIYGSGQLLHIGGLAVSGAMGIQRKTAGAAQGLDTLSAKAAMGVMGIGGLLAVVGGILFVLVVIKAFIARPRPLRTGT